MRFGLFHMFLLFNIEKTGKSTVAIAVAPKQIKYGFITVRSERWKTLRAMMLLDIAYLDADLRYDDRLPLHYSFSSPLSVVGHVHTSFMVGPVFAMQKSAGDASQMS